MLEGYNIVGDGTPQALLAILTGGWRVVGGMVMEGYNIVVDGTPQALLAILTGGWRVIGGDPTGTATYAHSWVEGGLRHGARRVQHSGRWDTTGTATYTHRWVEGGGMGPQGTATYAHRWVEGEEIGSHRWVKDDGMGPHKHCYLYSQVGRECWEAWCWRDTT